MTRLQPAFGSTANAVLATLFTLARVARTDTQAFARQWIFSTDAEESATHVEPTSAVRSNFGCGAKRAGGVL